MHSILLAYVYPNFLEFYFKSTTDEWALEVQNQNIMPIFYNMQNSWSYSAGHIIIKLL